MNLDNLASFTITPRVPTASLSPATTGTASSMCSTNASSTTETTSIPKTSLTERLRMNSDPTQDNLSRLLKNHTEVSSLDRDRERNRNPPEVVLRR